MGDHADNVINDILESEWRCEELYRSGNTQQLYEEGYCDELGYFFSPYTKGPHGIGLCPVCKSKTIKKNGKFGEFYDCVNFPKCKGSRSV